MLAYGQLTMRDREQLAAEMCHSPATQAQYQWIEPRQNNKRPSLQGDLLSKKGVMQREACGTKEDDTVGTYRFTQDPNP